MTTPFPNPANVRRAAFRMAPTSRRQAKRLHKLADELGAIRYGDEVVHSE